MASDNKSSLGQLPILAVSMAVARAAAAGGWPAAVFAPVWPMATLLTGAVMNVINGRLPMPPTNML